jgi:hypothetical protein
MAELLATPFFWLPKIFLHLVLVLCCCDLIEQVTWRWGQQVSQKRRYMTARCRKLEYHNLNFHHREDIKSHSMPGFSSFFTVRQPGWRNSRSQYTTAFFYVMSTKLSPHSVRHYLISVARRLYSELGRIWSQQDVMTYIKELARYLWEPGKLSENSDKAMGWMTRVRFLAGTDFLFPTVHRPALGPTLPPIKWIPGVLHSGVKRSDREADHWLEPVDTSTPPYVFLALCLIKYRDNLTTFIARFLPGWTDKTAKKTWIQITGLWADIETLIWQKRIANYREDLVSFNNAFPIAKINVARMINFKIMGL